MNIPDKIHMFNVYLNGKTLLGVSDEVTLPDFETITDTISGPGILGEIESPTMGHFGSMEMEIPFRQMDENMFSLVDMGTAVNVTLRGSIQYTVNSTAAGDYKPMRIVIKGRNKAISGGKAKQGAGTKSSMKIEIAYILIEINNVTIIELDKLNFIYKVNGKDLLEKVRKMC